MIILSPGAKVKGSSLCRILRRSSSYPITGYTIVTADDMAGATELAKGCPVLGNGLSVQISQAIDMG